MLDYKNLMGKESIKDVNIEVSYKFCRTYFGIQRYDNIFCRNNRYGLVLEQDGKRHFAITAGDNDQFIVLSVSDDWCDKYNCEFQVYSNYELPKYRHSFEKAPVLKSPIKVRSIVDLNKNGHLYNLFWENVKLKKRNIRLYLPREIRLYLIDDLDFLRVFALNLLLLPEEEAVKLLKNIRDRSNIKKVSSNISGLDKDIPMTIEFKTPLMYKGVSIVTKDI